MNSGSAQPRSRAPPRSGSGTSTSRCSPRRCAGAATGSSAGWTGRSPSPSDRGRHRPPPEAPAAAPDLARSCAARTSLVQAEHVPAHDGGAAARSPKATARAMPSGSVTHVVVHAASRTSLRPAATVSSCRGLNPPEPPRLPCSIIRSRSPRACSAAAKPGSAVTLAVPCSTTSTSSTTPTTLRGLPEHAQQRGAVVGPVQRGDADSVTVPAAALLRHLRGRPGGLLQHRRPRRRPGRTSTSRRRRRASGSGRRSWCWLPRRRWRSRRAGRCRRALER